MRKVEEFYETWNDAREEWFCPEAMLRFAEDYHKWMYKQAQDGFDVEEFEDFWQRYHERSGRPKTDKDAALKYWKRLTKVERLKATSQIMAYCSSIEDKRFIKKARTYLEDKNFNDEFAPQQSFSIGRNVSIDNLK
jgi:hypothetical protein